MKSCFSFVSTNFKKTLGYLNLIWAYGLVSILGLIVLLKILLLFTFGTFIYGKLFLILVTLGSLFYHGYDLFRDYEKNPLSWREMTYHLLLSLQILALFFVNVSDAFYCFMYYDLYYELPPEFPGELLDSKIEGGFTAIFNFFPMILTYIFSKINK
jgi:cation transport ATPase